jgi:hypothetical protein
VIGLAHSELSATAAIDPEATVVDTPGLTLNAGRAADLAVEANVATATSVAPVSSTIVGRAGDDLWEWWTALTEGEVGAATAVDPEAAIIDTPGLALDAG